MLELVAFCSKEKLTSPWCVLHEWLSAISSTPLLFSVKALTAKVKRLQTTRSKVVKTSSKTALANLLSSTFIFPQSALTKSEKAPSDVGVAVEVEEPGSSVHEVVGELGGESAVAEVGQGSGSEEVYKVVDRAECQGVQILSLEQRLSSSHNTVRNLSKKLRRRDDKINELGGRLQASVQSGVEKDDLEEELSRAQAKVDHLKQKLNNVYCRVAHERGKSDKMVSSVDCLNAELAESRRREREFQAMVRTLSEQLDFEKYFNSNPVITAKVDGKYTPAIRQCCYELLAKSVGVWNVKHVMQSVLNLAGTKISDIPSTGLLSQMLFELRQISQLQVASEGMRVCVEGLE